MTRLYESELRHYLELGIVDEVLGLINTGKEASVYLALAGENYRAIKIFKDRENRAFKNRADYFMQTIPHQKRAARAVRNKTSFGRKVEEALWRSREVDFLERLHAAGADVPEVFSVGENSFVMEYFGNEEGPAARLSDFRSGVPDPEALFERILWNIDLFLRNGIVHGDLSPYNILCPSPAKIVIIDFPQAVEMKMNDRAFDLLQRDLETLCAWFSRIGLKNDPREIIERFFG
jgi:RIO kinase 1